MAELKRLGVMSVAKLYAILMAICGFISGLFFSIIGFFSVFASHSSTLGFGLGIASIIIFPIMFAIIGFIVGAIGAFLYNLIAGKFGGIEIDFE